MLCSRHGFDSKASSFFNFSTGSGPSEFPTAFVVFVLVTVKGTKKFFLLFYRLVLDSVKLKKKQCVFGRTRWCLVVAGK